MRWVWAVRTAVRTAVRRGRFFSHGHGKQWATTKQSGPDSLDRGIARVREATELTKNLANNAPPRQKAVLGPVLSALWSAHHELLNARLSAGRKREEK
jgi:hypothetical protein